MDQFLEQYANVSNVLALFSLVLAYYFYIKSKQNFELYYTSVETSIIGDAEPRFSNDMQILYGGHSVPRVTSSIFAVWNGGNTTIKPEHFSPSGPLSFLPGNDATVLNATVLASVRSENITELRWTPGEAVPIVADYVFIRPQEGFVCEIIHSGGSGSFTVDGKFSEYRSRLMEAKRHFTGETL